MNVLCMAEDPGWLRQLAEPARRLGKALAAVPSRRLAEDAIKYFERVFVADLGVFEPWLYAEFLLKVDEATTAHMVILPSTGRGRAVAGLYAAKRRALCVTDVIGLEKREGAVIATRLVYGGMASAEVRVELPAVICVSPGAFPEAGPLAEAGSIEPVSLEAKPKARVTFKPREVTEADPSTAEVVVVAGRGVRKREDLKLVEELARALGGAWSVTRPLAADYGWADSWIGMTGLTIKPKLYVGVGVSGQPYHTVGIRGSKVVTAINTDPSAPIFEEADYGIVGDLYQVLPVLLRKLREMRGGT